MKIAVVGTGIAGMTAAHMLHPHHDLTVFEAADYIGGHTNTHDVYLNGRDYAVDTGFIVFNDWTYPNFIRLMDKLGVASQDSAMSFSVKCERTGLEYNGTSLNTLFAQRRNLASPYFWRMIRDIIRFNKEIKAWLAGNPDPKFTLGQFLKDGKYSEGLITHYIIPMGAAIWSAGRAVMEAFPLLFFAKFFNNHGMLNIGNRPTWRVIKGGSRSYIGPLTEAYKDRIQLSTPVTGIARTAHDVVLTTADGSRQRFDEVVLAVHSDQALRVLEDPSQEETDILGAIPYTANEAVLHTDTSVLPKSQRAWAAWNYHLLPQDSDLVAVTYNMNILQSLEGPDTFCVTLNYDQGINPAHIIKRINYHHPLFTMEGVAAQARVPEINGARRTYFCGAWCFNGFHEDGVRSGLRVANQILAQSNADAVEDLLEVGA